MNYYLSNNTNKIPKEAINAIVFAGHMYIVTNQTLTDWEQITKEEWNQVKDSITKVPQEEIQLTESEILMLGMAELFEENQRIKELLEEVLNNA